MNPRSFIRRLVWWANAGVFAPRSLSRWIGAANPRAGGVGLINVRALLVVRLDEIGDFVLFSAFLRELRASAPKAMITLIVKPMVYNLAENCPHVDKVLVYKDRISAGRFAEMGRQLRAICWTQIHLGGRRMEMAMVPRWDCDTYNAIRLMVYARAEIRVAYSEVSTSERRKENRDFDHLITDVISGESCVRHEVERSRYFLMQCGGRWMSDHLELWLSAADHAYAGDRLEGGVRYMAIATGASREWRRWPAERFSRLASWVAERHGLVPVLVGAPDDPGIPGIGNFRGQTLRQSAAIIARCVLFVGNDSGLMHVAAAVRVPVVEISGLREGNPEDHPSSPARFGPWGVPRRMVRPAAGPGEFAIDEVSLADVQAAAAELLAEVAERSARE